MIALSPNRFLFDSTLWDSNSVTLHSRFARFSVLMMRNGSAGQDVGFAGEAGLLMNGCYLEPASSRRTGDRIVNEYEQPVAFNGWFLRNGYDSPVTDMSLVILEISEDGEKWKNLAVSKPYCSLIRDSLELNYEGIEMPTTRGGEVVFDFTSSWCMTPTILVSVARLIEVFSLMLGFLFVWHGSDDLMLILCTGFTIASLLLIGSAILFRIGGECYGVPLTEGLTTLLLFPTPLIFSDIFGFEFGLIWAAVNLIDKVSNGNSQILSECFVAAVMISVIMTQIYVSRKARFDVRQDEQQFDKAWDRISRNEHAHIYLQSIQKTLLTVQRESYEISQRFQAAMQSITSTKQIDLGKGAVVVERNSPASLKMKNKLFRSTFIDRAKAEYQAYCISNLDQLYAQAILVYPLFLRKVQHIAHIAGGYFAGRGEDGAASYISWREAAGKPEEEAKIKWAGLKGSTRAVEKIVRSYGGDVSKLVDVVREAIVFDSLQDLSVAVQAITRDSEIRVMRIKNRFDEAYDARGSAGYRDVAINLCVVGEESGRVGVSRHVCELQCKLRELSIIESSDQHSRYLHYKSCYCDFLRSLTAAFQRKVDMFLKSKKPIRVKDIAISTRRVSDYASDLADKAQNSFDDFIKSCDGFSRLFQFSMLKISLPCNILDRALENGSNGFRNASWTSVLFSATPVRALLWKFQTIFLFSLIVFGLLGLFVLHRHDNESMNLFSARAVLFRTVKTRNGTDAALLTKPSVSDLVLYRSGCRVNQTSTKLWLNGADAVLYSKEVLGFNAVRFRNNEEQGTEWADAVIFQIYRMEEDFDPRQPSVAKKDWTLIATSSSQFLHLQCGEDAVKGSKNFLTSLQRGSFSEVDLRATWNFNLLQYGCYIPMIFAFLITALSRICNLIRLSQAFFCCSIAGPGVSVLVVMLGQWVEGRDLFYANFDTIIQGILWIMLGCLAWFRQKWFLSFIPVLWGTVFALSGVHSVVICGRLSFYLQPDPFAFLCIYALITLARYVSKFISFKKIEKDLKAYETEWKSIVQTDISDQQEMLKRVQENVRETIVRQLFDEIHQTESDQNFVSSNPQVSLTILPTPNIQPSPVKSLDQLYAQAILVYPLFLRKVQHIAHIAGGYFAGRGEDGAASYISWREAAGKPEEEAKIKWAGLKGSTRAVEKIVRSYGGDVSKLVDVVREAIVFDSLQDLSVAVQAITRDSEIRVMRIKNRFDEAYDARGSAGYRDVAINLCVVGEESGRVGVSRHVCELQLVLRSFMKLRNASGHKRYVSFRDLRGE
ncbi:hypothetical protein GUITHDRAFT_100517 [Guillardia theta CCMP2712]|uniref:Uncharacterized protein n=2 Tax=Guillardia theta TaxID=55529 RepID=L1JY75_GUITC|nr:hypothetical protein GUITHDRAFT_100517 [Guillardia theta CCMP2712]EKX53531.1 hypothetical protein GUITHDRAFT_100517 [Guillardia theta CCMP2712]|eukprot:XP_005840511.1 hypothetical protein GUITHDRAFT_100517 [Guillardia theta CCMP2712]